MKIGLIADDFTRINLELEPGLIVRNLTPAMLPFDLLRNLDCILVESAWRGYLNTWKGKIARYENKASTWLITLLKIARLRGIKTVFWNKEDPVSFDRFKHLCEYFDVVLTTEEELIPEYKKMVDKRVVVESQSFFFQPHLHNSAKNDDAKESEEILFCGGLYKSEFPDRFARLDMAVTALKNENIVVFDRFSSGDSSWESVFYENVIKKESFAYKQSKQYYQAGFAHLNVNSVDGSRTMFSRRMLELIACGSKVIDLTNFKNKSILSDFVIQASNKDEVRDALDRNMPNIDHTYIRENYSVASFIKRLKSYR